MKVISTFLLLLFVYIPAMAFEVPNKDALMGFKFGASEQLLILNGYIDPNTKNQDPYNENLIMYEMKNNGKYHKLFNTGYMYFYNGKLVKMMLLFDPVDRSEKAAKDLFNRACKRAEKKGYKLVADKSYDKVPSFSRDRFGFWDHVGFGTILFMKEFENDYSTMMIRTHPISIVASIVVICEIKDLNQKILQHNNSNVNRPLKF